MAEFRVRTEEGNPLVGARPIPLRHLRLSDSLQTFATVRSGTMLRVTGLSVVNVTGSAATITLHSVPPSGAAGDGNAELKAFSVAAATSVDLTALVGGLYEAGTTLEAVSSVDQALVLHGQAEEIL